MKLKNLLSFLFFLSPLTLAIECPPNNAPLCPESGSALLDETYPTQAFIMSNGPSFKRSPPPSKEHLKVTRDYINTIVKSYDYENVPQMMIAVNSEKEFESYKKGLRSDLENKKLSEDKINKIIGQLTHLKSPNYTWQQDYFESFVNLESGRPEVRHIESYYRMDKGTTSSMAKNGAACGIREGETIKSDVKSFNSGEMGGNIEGAPGGFCLVGNNQGPEFSKSFCGKEENIISLNVSWLTVGHVDEVFKIIPNHTNDNRPQECKFSLMTASPKKALELLKEPKLQKRPYFDFPASTSEEDLEDLRDSRSNVYSPTNELLCKYIVDAADAKPAKNKGTRPGETKSVFLESIMSTANAGAVRSGAGASSAISFKENCKKNVTEVSNLEMYEQFMKDTENHELNMEIQKSLEKDTALIKQKILSRLPQCAKYFDVIEVPNYFEGGPLITDPVTGQKKLPLDGNINAFLPNPTNSVLMNKTVLFSDAGNSAYSDYLMTEMEKRKMKSDFISTWDYAHLGNGNIHCSSHSLPYCKPRGK